MSKAIDDTWDPTDGIMSYADMSTRQYLAEPAKALKPYIDGAREYLYSEKKDGWHCIWDGKGSLFTKSGKLTFDAPPDVIRQFEKQFGNVAVSGELMVAGEQATEVAKLRKRSGPWDKFVFYAFDMPGKYSRTLPYTDRQRRLGQYQTSRETPTGINILPAYRLSVAEAFHERWTDITTCAGRYAWGDGPCLGEGVVITAANSLYEPRRVGKMTRIKLKRRADDEAEVIGYNEKSLKVRNLETKVEFTIGIGFTNAQRSDLPHAFPKGTIVKYSYRSLHASGKPKEARMVGIRDAADMLPSPTKPRKSAKKPAKTSAAPKRKSAKKPAKTSVAKRKSSKPKRKSASALKRKSSKPKPKRKSSKKPAKTSAAPKRKTTRKRRTRCPNGSRRSKKTGKCEPHKLSMRALEFPAADLYWAPERTEPYNALVKKIKNHFESGGPPLSDAEKRTWSWVASRSAQFQLETWLAERAALSNSAKV
jgi:hypothetical protein